MGCSTTHAWRVGSGRRWSSAEGDKLFFKPRTILQFGHSLERTRGAAVIHRQGGKGPRLVKASLRHRRSVVVHSQAQAIQATDHRNAGGPPNNTSASSSAASRHYRKFKFNNHSSVHLGRGTVRLGPIRYKCCLKGYC